MKARGFQAGVEYKGKVFFAAWECNAFCQVAPEEGVVHFIRFFEGEDMVPRLFSEAFLFGNEVWFMPATARHIVSINLDNNEISCYKLQFNKELEYSVEGSYFAFSQGIMDKEKGMLYFLPGCIDSMAIIDMRTHEVDWVHSAAQIEGAKADEVMKTAVLMDDNMYIFGRRKDYYETFDPEKKKIERIDCPVCREIEGIPFKLGNDIGFTDLFGKKIPLLSPDRMEVSPLDTAEEENSFAGAVDFGDDILLLPFLSFYFLIINKRNREVFKFVPDDDWIFNKEYSAIRQIQSDEGRYFVSSLDGSIVFFEDIDHCKAFKVKWETMWSEYRNALEKFNEMSKTLFAKNQISREDDLPLGAFLKYVNSL